MSWPLLGIVSLQFFSGALAVALAITAFRRRDLAGWPAVYFGLAALAVAVYSWGYALEVSSRTLEAVLTWTKIEYLGIPFIMPTWLLFSLALTGHEKWITRRRVLALLVIPLVTQTAAFTNEWHHLYYVNPHLQPAGPFLTLTFEKGPLYWLNVLYDNVSLLFTTGLLAQMAARSAPAFRRQAAFFMLGTAIQWAGLAIYVAGYSPYNLDLSSLSMSLCSLVFAVGLFRYRGLDVVPLAHDVIFEHMGDGVLVLDALDRLIDFNPAGQAMLPELQKSAIGQPAAAVLRAHATLVEQIAASAPGPVELAVNGTGPVRYYQCQLSPVLDWRHKAAGKIVTLADYSQTRQMLEQLRDLAIRDALTGAVNRRHFAELAEREIERRRRHPSAIALISVDLDHFKRINDTYGHAAGDAVLQAVAALYLRMIRATDVLGRLGGEEFLLLLPETPPAVAQAIAERLRQALEQQTVTYEGQTMTVTASFGVTGLDHGGPVSLDALMRQADKAMYAAKAAGRNCVVVRALEG
jgi:diguanylate cyclase (GGDEF)-like protein